MGESINYKLAVRFFFMDEFIIIRIDPKGHNIEPTINSRFSFSLLDSCSVLNFKPPYVCVIGVWVKMSIVNDADTEDKQEAITTIRTG